MSIQPANPRRSPARRHPIAATHDLSKLLQRHTVRRRAVAAAVDVTQSERVTEFVQRNALLKIYVVTYTTNEHALPEPFVAKVLMRE